ncbi:hypothetical protein TNCV_3133531 [Trichonephila clavipes]|nr:hypothetical protein TNCV_3133531 [Trichonephila clavipes]
MEIQWELGEILAIEPSWRPIWRPCWRLGDHVGEQFCFEHHSGDNTIWLGSTPILRENTLMVVRGLLPRFPFRQPHERNSARQLFRVAPRRKGIIHLQTSMPFPGFEPSPYGTTVSITNHYTGWKDEEESNDVMYNYKYDSSTEIDPNLEEGNTVVKINVLYVETQKHLGRT